jgi:hypothetical protein
MEGNKEPRQAARYEEKKKTQQSIHFVQDRTGSYEEKKATPLVFPNGMGRNEEKLTLAR